MILEIVTPDKKLFDGEVSLVRVPGSKGAFEILKKHAPIISTLDAGEIKVIKSSGEVVFFDINGGVVECNKDRVIVLAE